MMKLKYFVVFSVCLISLFAISCKKEEENTDFKYMTGKIEISFPKYVNPGDSKAFHVDTMSTLKSDDENPIGYYFRETVKDKADTVQSAGSSYAREFKYTVLDTLGSFTLSVFGYADHYYSSSASAQFTIVKPGFGEGCSLTDFAIDSSDEQFTDSRDGKSYYIAQVGELLWMRQNLAWEGAGRPFEGCKAVTDIFGQLYTWEEAQSACPDGWRLPAEDDWKLLVESCGETWSAQAPLKGLASKMTEAICFNGKELWPYSKDLIPNNKARLSVMPVGYAVDNGKGFAFDGMRRYAAIWSADVDGEDGVYRYINSDRDILYYGVQSKTGFAASVRCVKNK